MYAWLNRFTHSLVPFYTVRNDEFCWRFFSPYRGMLLYNIYQPSSLQCWICKIGTGAESSERENRSSRKKPSNKSDGKSYSITKRR